MSEFSAFRDVDKIPVTPLTSPFENIALAFSGGGFLAASYTLGVLSYLNRIKITDSKNTRLESLLDHVKYISATSGGTITAASFIIHSSKGKTFEEFYCQLLNNLQGDSFLRQALNILQDSKSWNNRKEKSHNLINAFALAFDQLFFDSFTVNDVAKIQKSSFKIEEICFNCTEFYKGLVFRQQFFLNNLPTPPQFCYGNFVVQVAPEAVDHLKISDMVAASCCQGATFEPILFPLDFATDQLTSENIKKHIHFEPQRDDNEERDFIERGCFGLMDGGLTDNQGLESLMETDLRRRSSKNDYAPFDFILVNDIDSHFMNPYIPPVIKKKPGISWNNLLLISILVAILGVFLIYKYWNTNSTVLLVSAILLPIFLLVPGITLFINVQIRNALRSKTGFKFSEGFTNRIIRTALRYLVGISSPVIIQMLKARFNSVLAINMDVFIKRTRFLLYERFYHTAHWKDRGKANHLYDLSFSNNINRENEKLPADFEPSHDMQKIAETAFRLGVTLWFDNETTKQKHALACVIATGQFTTCYNLLCYVRKLKDNSQQFGVFPVEFKQRLETLERSLANDYQSFKDNPFFYYNEIGELIGLDPVQANKIPMPEGFERRQKSPAVPQSTQ